MSDQEHQHDDHKQEAEELLSTLEQVEETLSVMTNVVSQLKEQVASHLDEDTTVEMSAEEFLEQCENAEGIWH